MRTIEYRATHVPAFLTKLWKLVTDTSSDDLISWSVGGTSFIIYDEIRFAKELLPMYFKHNNMASFVRQLNMYGFRKLSCIDQGGMHSMKHEIEFYHQYFIKNQETLLELIKRKIPTNRSSDESKIKPEYVKELISSIKYLQSKQQTSDEGMKNLRKENKLLWRQLTLLNSRYMKQQAMLQQVLPIFMNIMHSGPRLSLKRRTPLMIHEGESPAKSPRLEPSYYVEHIDSDMSSDLTHSPGNISNRGPVIREVTEMESNKVYSDTLLCSSNAPKENDVIVDSPLSSLGSSERTVDSPFTETAAAAAEAMEPLNVLGCTFESLNNLQSQVEMPPPKQIPTPQLIVQDSGLAPRMGNMSSLSPTMPSTPLRQECSSTVPPSATATSPVPMAAGAPFAPSPSRSPAEKPLSVMDILNEASNSAPGPSTSSLTPEEQGIQNILQWLPQASVPVANATASAVAAAAAAAYSEQNLDNWLGQLFTDDNLVAGASLPSKLG